jgi:hypothetical protein
VQGIDFNLLANNRNRLIVWQNDHWHRKVDGLRLHLGSGHLHLDEYLNIDPYTKESDIKDDMRYLFTQKPNSVVEMVSHHALEHIPMRDVWKTLQRWYEILMPGGTLEIGMPDIELSCQLFVEAPEDAKWGWHIWTIYGAQADTNSPMNDRDNAPFEKGQLHMSGFSLGHFIRMLEDIGFRMIDAYHYDGYGTPSFFVYAEKPTSAVMGSILEQNTVIGTFTNKADMLPTLWASAQNHIPEVQFVTRVQRGPINTGMSLLREDFIKTGKRYWCFLDDDIQFLNPDIMRNALRELVAGKYGAMSVYSTFEESSLTSPYNPKRPELIARPLKWAVGYFILVDSQKVGHILPDMNLPDPNTSIDTSYSVSIRAAGFDIGISPDYVYHFKKPVYSDQKVIDITNQYLMKKWGKFYYDWTGYDNVVIDAGWRV